MIAQPGVKELFNQLGIMEAITHARSITIEWNLANLDFLVSR